MSPHAMAFTDGTAQVRAARAGLRDPPLRHESIGMRQEYDWGWLRRFARLAGGRVSCAKGRRLLLLFR